MGAGAAEAGLQLFAQKLSACLQPAVLTVMLAQGREHLVRDVERRQNRDFGCGQTGRPVGDFAHRPVDMVRHTRHILRIRIPLGAKRIFVTEDVDANRF